MKKNPTNLLTKRVNNLSTSQTFAIDTKVKEFKAKNITVVNLGIGEPDFNTPYNIKKAAILAIKENFTHYTQGEGILELREAIAKKLLADNKLFYKPSQIIVGSGSKPLLFFAFQTFFENGDEVLIPIPTWSTYVEQIKLTGAKPVLIKLDPPFELTVKDIKKYLSSKTKGIIVNNPCNPTGAIIKESELKKIARLAVKHNLWLVSDEMYDKIIYDRKFVSIASFNKQIKEKTIVINGLSKTYAMTGWRLGYTAGPESVIRAMSSLQSQITANANSITQKAAIEALNGSQNAAKLMQKEFEKRRNFLIREFAKIKKLSYSTPQGTFYMFISVEKLLGRKFKTSSDWCEALLLQKKVAVIPGEAFLYPGYFRLSFVAPIDQLKTAIEKIKEFIDEN